MKVLLRWSDGLSHDVAGLLSEKLRSLFPDVQLVDTIDPLTVGSPPLVDSNSLLSFMPWDKWSETDIGILCLTKDNLPWMVLEADLIDRSLSQKSIFIFPIGIDGSDLPEQLSRYPLTPVTKEGLRNIVDRLTGGLEEGSTIPHLDSSKIVEELYNQLKPKIDKLLKLSRESKRDLLAAKQRGSETFDKLWETLFHA